MDEGYLNISREELEEALGQSVEVAAAKSQGGGQPLSPGMKYRHYSPRARLILITGPAPARFSLIKGLADYYRRLGLKVGYLNTSLKRSLKHRIGPEKLAAGLYDSMRRMDRQGVDIILAEEIDATGIGLAVMNRLKKAASRILRVQP